MKKTKIVSLLMAMVMCCSLLTGCMGAVADVQINKDGSGVATVSAGMTKDALDMMASMENIDPATGESVEVEADLSEYTKFEYNGVTYYGEVETEKFANVDEFNALMSDTESESEVDSGMFKLAMNKDGSLALTFTATPETGDTTEMEQSAAGSGMEAAMIEALFADMAIVYNFEFPENVTQVAGPSDGITIDGKKLSVDILKIGTGLKGETEFVFTTGKMDPKPIVFTDVKNGAWYYNAVMAMAEGGLVAGVGNNKFNPEGTLTYAQFCTILARAKMLDTTSQNGYWAYGSIKSCIQAGYIVDRGEITSANYDVAIPREAAVRAMFKGKQAELFLPVVDLTEADIPDFDKISESYKEDILNAYKYGITAGMDSNRTFNPQGQLTRAQVCQLFYNLDWTAPLANVGGSSSN